MTATAAPSRLAPFDIGRVLGRSFAFTGSRWLTLLLLAIVIGWLPEAPLAWLRLQPARLDAAWRGEASTVLLLRSLADLVLRSVVLALALAWPATRMTVGQGFAAFGRAALTLAPWWLLEVGPQAGAIWLPPTALADRLVEAWVVYGATWLFAVALSLTIGVYSAVVLAERRGFWPSLRRAAMLMGGGRWKFTLLYLMFQLAVVIVSVAASVAADFALRADPAHFPMWVAIAPSIGGGLARLIYPLWSAITAMSYRELARLHGGVAPDDVAHVFA